MEFAPIEQVIEALKNGEQIVLVDDENRENEGDLVMLGDRATPADIAFMARYGCGLICLAMDGELVDHLGLPLMTRDNRSPIATAFTLSIDAAQGVTTGISAADRVRTVAAAIADNAKPEDVVTPGHMFPLRALEGGVLRRAGHTEAAVDLALLAGAKPAGIICEIMNEDGTMARLPQLKQFCQQHNILLASIAHLIAYRERTESLISLAAESQLTLPGLGACRAYSFLSQVDGDEHLALVFGDKLGPGKIVEEPVMVRVQKENALSDVFGVGNFGAYRAQVAAKQIAESGDGVLLYLREHSGRRLSNLLVQTGGTKHLASDTQQQVGNPMDPREYGVGAQILQELGVRHMRLITGSTGHIAGLAGYRLEVVEAVPFAT